MKLPQIATNMKATTAQEGCQTQSKIAMGCGPSAPPLPEVTGHETDDELRDLISRGSADAAITRLSLYEECDLSLGPVSYELPTHVVHGEKPLGRKGADALGIAMVTSACKVKKLVLAGTRLGGGSDVAAGMGMKKFAFGLTENTTIEVLDLSANAITDYSAAKLAAALETNRTLKTLILSFNGIGEVGAHAIAKALDGNDALTVLHLNGNHIDSSGTTRLAKALATNKSLKVLRYEDGDMFDPKEVQRLVRIGRSVPELSGGQSSYLTAQALRDLAKARPDLDVTFTSKPAQGPECIQHLQYIGGELVRTVDYEGDSGPPAVAASVAASDVGVRVADPRPAAADAD